MQLESWISLQQHTVGRLRVQPGTYVCRHRAGSYTASLKLTSAHDPFEGTVTRDDFGVRVRVHIWTREYDFGPRWQVGKGLAVARVSPASVDRESAVMAAGYARAALLAAAREEHDRMSGIAHDVAERTGAPWDLLLIGLTMGSLEARHRAAIVEVLGERDDGVELAEVRREAECIGCRRRFWQGDRERLVSVGTLTACRACLSGGVGGASAQTATAAE